MQIHLGVAGVGLIGCSIALRATELGMLVVGFDPDPQAIEIARERGAVARSVATFEELAQAAGVLVLAGPLDATLAQLEHLARVPSGCFPIFDVASVKSPVSQAGTHVRGFVASHPIAGSERSGPAAARADLFEGRTWTIDADADPAARTVTRTLLEAFGAHVIEISSAEHDRTIALTSHLPQVLSVALGAQLSENFAGDATRELCGTGIRSMLRLGASSWEVWRAVLDANSVYVAQEVRRCAAILIEAAQALETDSTGALAARFASAASAVARVGDRAPDRKGEP